MSDPKARAVIAGAVSDWKDGTYGSLHAEQADIILSALDKAGMTIVDKEPNDSFWERVKFHDGEFSKSGETYPVQRNLWRAALAAHKEGG